MTITPERRAENMRLRAAATPGPWRYEVLEPPSHPGGYENARVVNNEHTTICDNEPYYPEFVAPVDQQYIVAACNDLPLYEAALAERDKEIERLKSRLHEQTLATLATASRISEEVNAAIYYGGGFIDTDNPEQHPAAQNVAMVLRRLKAALEENERQVR